MSRVIKLSIIIPCYNCEHTLAEAVSSCYTQNISDNEFEIIMVDDGSSDGTAALMEKLADTHTNITLLSHNENKGGGAARNSGIRIARGEIIYCLDSDNIFAPNSVHEILEYQKKYNADGVAFYERRFFNDTYKGSYTPKYNQIIDRAITLEDLLTEQSIMLDNFFFTKSAYLRTNKYPEHHGFDTQTYEFDFLAKRNTVYVCPNSIFYHRQNQTGHKSYYEREYERGLISINTYLALEPIIEALDPVIIDQIVRFDLYKKNYHGRGTHLRSSLSALVQSGNPLLKSESTTSSPIASLYIETLVHLQQREYDQATDTLNKCIHTVGEETPLLHYIGLRLSYTAKDVPIKDIHEKIVRDLHNSNLLNLPRYKRIPKILKPLHAIYLHIFK